jgi:hypothetical protein
VTSSNAAKTIMIQARHVIAAKATDVVSAKTSDATAAKAADATSTEATHVASAKAAAMSSTSAAATGLCTGGKKAAGKHSACQNHHYSSSHDILHLRWADFPPRGRSGVGASQKRRASVAIVWRWECWSAVSTKFAFIRIERNLVLERCEHRCR